MGEDSLETFSTWHRAAQIAGLCELAAAPRRGETPASGVRSRPTELLGAPVHWLHAEPPTVSSTAVRRALAAAGDVSGLLDPRVEAYIREHGLYGSSV